LISAKSSVQSDKTYKVTSCKTVARCLPLYDAPTIKQARMTSFFIVVDFTNEMAYLLPICGGFGGM